jgi:hypothetical protein
VTGPGGAYGNRGGCFTNRQEAANAVGRLRSIGVPSDRIAVISPATPPGDLKAGIPTEEAEPPGVGQAIGAVVGGAAGASAGIQLATVATTAMFLPLVGPVLATGLIAGAVLGLGAGVAVGNAVERSGAIGLPKDELYVYEDALRRGRTVVVALVHHEIADAARAAVHASSAETVDAARESWWIGLREPEAVRYTASGGDFGRDEARYRQGFEAALSQDMRGTTYQASRQLLQERYPGLYEEEAFRRGWEGGQAYARALAERRTP